MNEEEFRNYLKKKGKKAEVIDRNVLAVRKFTDFLGKEIHQVAKKDVDSYIEEIEKKQKKSAKGALYVLMNYYKFSEDKEMLSYVAKQREERTKKTRRIFPLKEFFEVNQEHVKKLATVGIRNVEQMLEAGKTIEQRNQLSQQLSIPEEGILTLVELSDITRIGYVKSKLAALYHKAGFDTPTKIAKYNPEELHAYFVKFTEETSWEGMVPNPSDLVHNIESAKKLKDIVEK